MKLPARVTICEVGTRDGFQIEPDFIPTEQNIEVELIDGDAGVVVVERGVHVRAAVDAAGEFADIARRAVAQTADEFEIELGVARPRCGGVGERVRNVDELHGGGTRLT